MRQLLCGSHLQPRALVPQPPKAINANIAVLVRGEQGQQGQHLCRRTDRRAGTHQSRTSPPNS